MVSVHRPGYCVPIWRYRPHVASSETPPERLALFSAKRLRPLGPFAHGFAMDDMLLENALATLGRDPAVPGAFGINEEPRAADADAKAAGLGPHHGEIQLGAPALEIIPRRLPLLRRRAIGAEAEEEMPLGLRDAGRFKTPTDGVVFGHALGVSAGERIEVVHAHALEITLIARGDGQIIVLCRSGK